MITPILGEDVSIEPRCMGHKKKRKKYCRVVYVLIVLLLNIGAVLAQTADQYFDLGVRAAQQQQNQAALEAFLQAKAGGLESPELIYNLGVVYYNLAQYDDARTYFQRLIEYPEYSAVAFYNLGLISLKFDDESAAKEWFLQAYDFAADPQVKDISGRALRQLNVDPSSTESPLAGWNGLVSLSAGYDDNVSLIDEDLSEVNGIEDSHLELFATTNRMLWGNDDNGVHFDANADILKQQHEYDYDYSHWHLGLAHRGRFSRWQTRARASIDQTYSGNADFQQLLSLDLRGQRTFNAKTGMEWRYKYVNIEDQSPDGVYDYLAGNRQQVRVRWLNTLKNINFKYSYELQVNDRNDFSDSTTDTVNNTTTVTTRSFSPMRHSVQILADWPWGKSVIVSLEAQYRYSDYADPDTQVTFDTASGDIQESTVLNRKDRRYQLSVGLAYRITSSLELFADYGYTKNDSNRDGSDYDRSLSRAGVTWFY